MQPDSAASAVAFTRMWCALFVGDEPAIDQAMDCFDGAAAILIPGAPYRLTPAADREEILYSHLVDGRGHVHFWQVLEPHVAGTDDLAVVSYYARYCVGRKGESAVKCARETLVLQRTEHAWKIVHLHNSMA